MTKERVFTLTNGEKTTAKLLAKELNISVCAARFRLKKSLDKEVITQTTYQLLASESKIHILSDGTQGTVRELSRIAKIAENTIRIRLSKSLNYQYVMKPEVFKNLGATIYMLSDGTEITAKEHSLENDISIHSATETLKAICVSSRKHVTKYTLDNGQVVTLSEVMEITGLSLSAAKKRLKSRVASQVLKPHRINALKPKTATIKVLPIKKLGQRYRQVQCEITGKLTREAI